MQQTSITLARTSLTRPRVRGAALAAALIGVSIPLAAPGPELVPGAGPDAPRWVLGVYGDGLGLSPGAYLALLYAAVVLWIGLLAHAGEIGLRAIGWAAGLLIALFALAPPLLSLDLFSYVSYARLGTEGLNPYEFAPAAIPTDQAAERVDDFRDAVSVYGPLFTLASYPLGALGVTAAVWSLKALAALSIAGIAVLVARLAAWRGVDPAVAVAFVALNPLILVHLVGGAHNDGLMTMLAVAATAAVVSARPLAAGAGLVAAAAIKVAALLYAPFALLGAPSGQRLRLIAGAVAALTLIAAVSLPVFGTSVGEALSVAGGNQERISRWSVPGTLARITGTDVDLFRAALGIAYAASVAALLFAVHRGLDWVRAVGWASLGILVASAYMVPWYLIWLVPFAAVSRDRTLIGATILLTLFQVINAVPI